MANETEAPLGVERNAHLAFLAALAGVFLVAGTVTKNERAVFLTDGTGLPAKAFAAMLPPAPAVYRGPYARFTGRDFSRAETPEFAPGRSATAPRSGQSVSSFVAPPGDATVISTPPGATLAAVPPSAATIDPTQVASLPPSQFTPSVPQPSGGGGTAVGAPGETTPGTPTTPTTPGTPTTPTNPGTPTTPTGPATPTAPGTPTNPVSAVPESATWQMLLAGFLAIGIALRRRPLARLRSRAAGLSS